MQTLPKKGAEWTRYTRVAGGIQQIWRRQVELRPVLAAAARTTTKKRSD
jgi:hypothetical protein